jgi:hypothetical protein
MNLPAIQSGDGPLIIFEDARRQIAEAATVDQVNKVLALATGLAAAARKATDRELEAEAAVLKFEAERKLGQLMEQQKETVGFNVGTRGSKVKGARVSEKPTLKEAGIDKNTAHRARKAHAVPEAEVEKKKEEIRARVKAPPATTKEPARAPQKAPPIKSKASVHPKDIALERFDTLHLKAVAGFGRVTYRRNLPKPCTTASFVKRTPTRITSNGRKNRRSCGRRRTNCGE